MGERTGPRAESCDVPTPRSNVQQSSTFKRRAQRSTLKWRAQRSTLNAQRSIDAQRPALKAPASSSSSSFFPSSSFHCCCSSSFLCCSSSCSSCASSSTSVFPPICEVPPPPLSSSSSSSSSSSLLLLVYPSLRVQSLFLPSLTLPRSPRCPRSSSSSSSSASCSTMASSSIVQQVAAQPDLNGAWCLIESAPGPSPVPAMPSLRTERGQRGSG